MKLQEEFEDTEGVIRIRILNNRQHNGQKKINKRTNNDLQNIHITIDRLTRTPLKPVGEFGRSGRINSSCATSDIRCVNLVTNPVISHGGG